VQYWWIILGKVIQIHVAFCTALVGCESEWRLPLRERIREAHGFEYG
jgi:hypothetical protein